MRIIRTSNAFAVSLTHSFMRRAAVLAVVFWFGMVAQWMVAR